ncbi:NAD(P)/FAD-dependent oxidoreductase [Tessaracoccus sp. G1721]
MTTYSRTVTPRVAIVGAGPAGLTCAAELGRRYGSNVLLIDREKDLGGIPRHSDHPGYGIRDLHRFMSGPAYARRLAADARAAGVTVMTETQVTGWTDDGLGLAATSASGRILIKPDAVVLATGARERPRTARLIPGDRPAGILTTGQLQNLVHLHHQKVGTRAVIVGAELVSWSAALTLKEAGCATVALVSQYASPESYALFTHPGKLFFGTKVITDSKVVLVEGRGRVRAVVIENQATGERRSIECDTVVFTGDWVPDHEIARLGGLDMDPASKSPVVDSSLRTSRDGVFAIGNLLHPVETADCAALDGRHVAEQVTRYIDGQRPRESAVRLLVDKPLRWVAPNLLREGDPLPARNRLVLWTDEFKRSPVVEVRQGGQLLSRTRLSWPAAPGRAFRIPSSVLEHVDRRADDVRISIV